MAPFVVRTVDKTLVKRVKDYIEQGDSKALIKVIDHIKAADLADLIEYLQPDERLLIFKLLEPEGVGDVFVEIEPPVQERILRDLDNQAISEIVKKLDSDDAADLMGDLPGERAKEIIKTVGDDVSEDLEKLLPYPEDTAGGIMALELVSVNADITLRDAVESIREKREEVENLYHVWAVDDFERLVGVVSLKDFILEPPERKVSDIMNPEIISINAYSDQEEAIQLTRKYDLVNIPVVDEQNRLIGRITHDDIIDT
ncbi:MAG: magnesium transporter [Deltaproteobacteria bacterium]|nr:magnesium transporter [Deltaproteobacteria bacterium]